MRFDNSYARLPDRFYERIDPVLVNEPELIRLNRPLMQSMELDLPEDKTEVAAILSGNKVPEGAEPLAMAYAGHQFGGFVPQLGDGRAVLLGEVLTEEGRRYDIQLKGSGQTRFSRAGDGRSALGPVLREYIVSEAMHALGIPTTRSLAMVSTGETVFREKPTPGGVLTRVSSGLVRVGTFEYFAAREDWEAVRLLADYVIERHYPAASKSSTPYLDLYRLVCIATAELVARWMGVGFIHGVMNTDNTAISGETIDYGPCAFMDTYEPDKVFSSIDHFGRYAYNNQPTIAQWNMAAFGGCLLPLISDNEEEARNAAQATLETFSSIFKQSYQKVLTEKIGLPDTEDGFEHARQLLGLMHADHLDFTVAFRTLAEDIDAFTGLFINSAAITSWIGEWERYLEGAGVTPDQSMQRMRRVNPAYIPRNHRVEQAIRAAEDDGDYTLTHRLIEVLERPYEDQPEFHDYRTPPKPEEIVRQTFCGT